MNKELLLLQKRALEDASLKRAFLKTKSAEDPLDAFCALCAECGYPITIGELIAMGDDFCDSMLRSVNGGGVEAPDFWSDAYELFMAALEKSSR